MTTGITGYNPNSTIYNGLKAVAANHSNDVGNLVKFVQGEPMQGVPDATLGSTVLWTLPAMTVFGGVKGVPWLVQNRHDLKGAAAALRTEALAANGKNIPKNFATGLKDYTTKLFKGLTPAEKAALAAKPRSWFGKMLDMIPGYKKLRPTGFGQAMGRSGAGFMIAAEGLMSTFTEVVPAFQQGGAKSGFKQIAKSGTKVAANAAGWIAGEAIGSAAGMAIGTAICPGVGTAIGKFVGGFLGGAIACHFAGKAATKLTGKSETELLKEKQFADQTAQVENDAAAKNQLAQESIAYANEILKVDPNNKEALVALASANNILQEQQTAQNTEAPAAQPKGGQPAAMPEYPAQNTIAQALPFVPVVPGFDGSKYDMNIYNQMRQNASFFNPTAQVTDAQLQQAAARALQITAPQQNPVTPGQPQEQPAA